MYKKLITMVTHWSGVGMNVENSEDRGQWKPSDFSLNTFHAFDFEP